MGWLSLFDLSKIDAEILIETGCFYGDSIAHGLKFKNIKTIYSCDIDIDMINHCVKRFPTSRVQLTHSTSLDFLNTILPGIEPSKNIVFWLDAHFPYADRGLATYISEPNRKLRVPLEYEIEIIFKYRNPLYCKDVLIIDDLHIYEDGPFGNGNWPHRKDYGGNGIEFMNIYNETHDIIRLWHYEGYIVVLPKNARTDILFPIQQHRQSILPP